MNRALIKCLATFGVFAIIGFGPISPGCLIGMYVTVMRPSWFLALTRELYSDNGRPLYTLSVDPKQARYSRRKCFAGLLALFILDIAPVPVTPTVAFAILLSRPLWFYRMVENVYYRAESA